MEINYIEIGKIVNTFGIKGELKITTESDFVDYRYRIGGTIFIKYGKQYIECKVSSMRLIKGCVCITINDLFDINEVVKYIGCFVYADASDKPKLEDGTYMIDDLVGLKVFNQKKELIGRVSDVLIMPRHDILEVENSGKKTLIPFVDEYILEVTDEDITVKVLEVLE